MQGVIAAGHPDTAAAGAEILQKGGNAVDAAAAATFASFIAEAVLVNIGGGGIAQVYNPASGQVMAFDFFSNMPGLAANGQADPAELDFREILVDFGPAQQPFYIGRGSVAVPGVVAGLCRMVSQMGRLSLPQVLAPAMRLAREGAALSEALAYVADILAPILTDSPEIAAHFAPDGHIVTTGDLLRFPDLADTLQQLGQQGPALFYTGDVARKILADQQTRRGLLTETDLAAYRVHRLEPIRLDYRGYTILLPPPSSNGGLLIAFALKLLATISLERIQHNSFEHLRLLAEVMRFSTAARTQWDRDCGGNVAALPRPELAACLEQFLASDNIKKYSRRLQQALVNPETRPEIDSPRGPAQTTHVSVADANGMIAGITTSAGENAGFMIDGTGVMLNNMLGEIDLHPDGFHQLPPGRRLITMMSPVLILRQQRPILAVGSGGSNRLRSAILQVVSNFIDFKMHLDEAVDAARLHFENNVVELEGGITSQAADQLEAAGYIVNRWPERNMFFGGAHAVAQEAGSNGQNSHWVAAGDRRRGGSIVIV